MFTWRSMSTSSMVPYSLQQHEVRGWGEAGVPPVPQAGGLVGIVMGTRGSLHPEVAWGECGGPGDATSG